MADKSEWKTPSMESEGKGDGHKNGRKPRTPEPISIAGKVGNSPSEEEMGHWTPTGRAYFNSLNGGTNVPPLSGFVPPLKCIPPPILCGGLSWNLTGFLYFW